MTKFVGVARASRAKRVPGSTAADKRIALAMYTLTGEHPEQEELTAGTSLDAAAAPAGPQQVHFTFALDGAPFGEPVVVELNEDRAPEAVSAFRARATGAEGRAGILEYEGAGVARVARGVRVDIGAAAASSGYAALEDASLRHDQAGVVSMSLAALRCTITLAACPELDGRQQVVGRVVAGLATVQSLSELEADDAGKPARSVLVCCCGTFASAGGGERTAALAAEVRAQAKAREFAEKAETPAETRARLQTESSAARGAVDDAVHEALERSKRRKVETSAAPAAGKGRMFDSLLGGAPGSSDSDEA
jgi:cyclophilin family peptidyl-prolyl cis-trans isomerase